MVLNRAYNSYTVIVDVCLIVELFFDFCVLLVWPVIAQLATCRCIWSKRTYFRPLGWRLVWLTAGGAIVPENAVEMEVE